MEDALLVFMLLNIADILTTRRALSMGGKEANPVARWVLEKYGVRGLWFFKMAVFGGIGIAGFLGLVGEGILWVYNVVFGGIVAWNSLMNYLLARRR